MAPRSLAGALARVLVVGLAGLLLAGCAHRTPSQVCDKIGALLQHGTEIPALSHDACVEQLQDMMQQDRRAYDCTADCVLGAADASAATACVARCKSPGK